MDANGRGCVVRRSGTAALGRRLRRVGPAAALTLLVACGGQDGSTVPGSPTATADSPKETSEPTASVSTPVEDLPVPDPTGKPVVVTGTVAPGVEVGCLLLTTPGDTYLLLGAGARDLRIGSTITVDGIVRRDLASTCQQGKPLQVTEIRSE